MLSPATPLPYADLSTRLAALDAQEGAAYVRHAARPVAVGSDVAFLKLFSQRYEARASLSEQNPAFAATLLPHAGAGAAIGQGLPLLPAGVLVQVDAPRPGYITVSLDVTGAVSLNVAPPTGAPFTVTPTLTAGRQTISFRALLDGLYALNLSVQGATLGALYVVVCRHEYALFREQSRALAFAFRVAPPRPTDEYLELLACLAFAEAAAATGDRPLAAACLQAAREVPATPTPVGIYPYPSHDA